MSECTSLFCNYETEYQDKSGQGVVSDISASSCFMGFIFAVDFFKMYILGMICCCKVSFCVENDRLCEIK